MEDQFRSRLEKIEAEIDKWLPEKPGPSWMDKVFTGVLPAGGSVPVRAELAASLSLPGWDLVKRGGKRWRPLLMLLAAESLGGEDGGQAALPLTPLVEFPHNASLIHDDIEDNADERRGKPAVHLIYGTDTAINAGSFLYFLPLACLSAWGDKNKIAPALGEKIWTVWGTHMRALHLGQAMDIFWHRDFLSLPELDEYDRMCRLKTGCLARLGAVLGAYIGAARQQSASANAVNIEDLVKTYGRAAEQLGVGFQILDDVKNLSTGVPGKKRGDDIVEGKKSLPVLLYLHRYPEKRDFAARCFKAARDAGTTAPETEEIIAALEGAGILKEAWEKGLGYIQESKEAFAGQELIRGLIDSLI